MAAKARYLMKVHYVRVDPEEDTREVPLDPEKETREVPLNPEEGTQEVLSDSAKETRRRNRIARTRNGGRRRIRRR